VNLRFDAGKATVLGSTLIGSPLYGAGVDRNDRIVSLDGKSVGSQGDLDAILAARKPGDAVPLVFESRASTLNATLTLSESPRIEIVTFEKAGEPVGDEVRAFRKAWLERQEK
jgi:predicted metalloprotease with PDZ domain